MGVLFWDAERRFLRPAVCGGRLILLQVLQGDAGRLDHKRREIAVLPADHLFDLFN